MRPAAGFAFTLALAVALAGCSGGKGGEAGDGTRPSDETLAGLHGWVFDSAIRPLAGATVKVIDTNTSVVTDAEGRYGMDGLPVEQFLIVVATLDGYTASSKQITLAPDTPVRLNFTLEAEPVMAPSTELREFNGIIGCQAAVVVSEQNQTHDCGAGNLEQRDRWEFSLGPDLAGAVIEVSWNPQTQASESLGAKLETLELGKLNLVLGDLVGTSPLRVLVPESVAKKYYVEGGLMRLTVFARSNGEEVESGVGASIHVQQTFNAYATLCYVEPPAPSYSFVTGSKDCQDG